MSTSSPTTAGSGKSRVDSSESPVALRSSCRLLQPQSRPRSAQDARAPSASVKRLWPASGTQPRNYLKPKLQGGQDLCFHARRTSGGLSSQLPLNRGLTNDSLRPCHCLAPVSSLQKKNDSQPCSGSGSPGVKPGEEIWDQKALESGPTEPCGEGGGGRARGGAGATVVTKSSADLWAAQALGPAELS